MYLFFIFLIDLSFLRMVDVSGRFLCCLLAIFGCKYVENEFSTQKTLVGLLYYHLHIFLKKLLI